MAGTVAKQNHECIKRKGTEVEWSGVASSINKDGQRNLHSFVPIP